MAHLSTAQLEAGLAALAPFPTDKGTLDLLVARPENDKREVLEAGELVVGEGLAGDNYLVRGSSQTDNGEAHPEAQLNVMNSSCVNLVADNDQELWPLAGDQLFVDLDLSTTNLPVGTRLAIGTAIIEVSAKPHTGCAKFAKRFGMDAARWINSDPDRRFRGLNAIVIQAGSVKPGDEISKIA